MTRTRLETGLLPFQSGLSVLTGLRTVDRTDLIVLVTQTEVLQELVGQPHQLVHPDVLLGIEWNLQ